MMHAQSECGGIVHHLDESQIPSIDSAWESRQYDHVLSLLLKDSDFPRKFDLRELNEEDGIQGKVKDFAQERNLLHEWIKNDKLEEVKEFTSKNESKYYLNDSNYSAIFTALKYRKFKIFAYLQSIGVFFAKYEVGEMDNLNEVERNELRDVMFLNFKASPDSHILHIISKLKVNSPDSFEHSKEIITGYLDKLDKIEGVSIILRVIEHVHNLSLVLDLSNKSLKIVCPGSSKADKGMTLAQQGTIYVAAGGKRSENEILGTMAHELTHMAMELIFKNNCNPYFKSDEESRREFQAVAQFVDENVEIKNSPSETLTDALADSYMESDQELSELIARVPHILAQYADGKDWLETNVPGLLKFYMENVIPKCEKFISENHLLKPKRLNRYMNESEGEIINIKKCGLFFDKIDKLRRFLNLSSKNIFALIIQYTWLGLVRALQAMYGADYFELYDRFLVFKLKSIVKSLEDVEYVFNTEATEMLFVECPDNIGNDYKSLKCIEKMIKIVGAKKDKKIIFIMKEEENENFMKILDDHELSDGFAKENDVDFSLCELGSTSRWIILDKPVLFQGKEFRLGDLVNGNEDLLECVNAGIIQDILNNNKKIKIGSKPLGSSSLEGAYADVVLEVNPSTLMHEMKSSKDVFLICGKKKEFRKCLNEEIDISITVELKNLEHEITNNKRIFLTDEDVNDDDFKKFCDLNSKKKIYLIEHSKESAYILSKVYNPEFYFKRRMRKGSSRSVTDNDLSKEIVMDESELALNVKEEKVLILADEPGMGKSTTLTKLYEIENISDAHWIIRINLKDYLIPIRNMNGVNIKQVTKFLMEIDSKLKNDFSRKLLQAALDINKNFCKILLLCFDGFDELSDKKDRQKIVDLLKFLKDNTKSKIWVTTRLHFKEELENKLSVFSIRFDPIEDSSKMDFIKNFMIVRLRLILTKQHFDEVFGSGDVIEEGSKLWTYAKKFIDKAKSIFKDNVESFIGTPLQLHLLLENSAASFRDWTENSKDPEFSYLGNDWVEVFKKYFDRKYEIYCKKKNLLEEESKDMIKEKFDKCHEKIAKSLVNDQKLDEAKMTKWISSLLLLGITKAENNRIEFVHFTFQEYYYVQYSITIFNNRQTLPQGFSESFIIEIEKHQLVRNFLNVHLRNSAFREVLKKFEGELREVIMTSLPHRIFHFTILDNNNDLFDFLFTLNFTKVDYYRLLVDKSDYEFLLHFTIQWKKDFALNRMIGIASKYGFIEKLLSMKNGFGCYPLHLAIQHKNDYAFNRIIEIASEYKFIGPLLNWTTSDGTALNLAVKCKNDNALTKIMEIASKYNLEQEILSFRQNEESPPLHTAVKTKNDFAFDQIIGMASKFDFGISILSALDTNGKTAFHIAVGNKNDYALKRIIEIASKYHLNKRFVSIVAKYRGTAMHAADEYGDLFNFWRMVEIKSKNNLHHGHLNTPSLYEETAFHTAIRMKNDYALDKIIEIGFEDNLIQQLLESIAKYEGTTFSLAFDYGNDFVMNQFIKSSSNYSLEQQLAIIRNEDTAFHLAIRSQNDYALNKIIGLASENNLNQQLLYTVDNHKNTSLHLAVKFGNDVALKSIVQLALKEVLDEQCKLLNMVDEDENTVLHLAATTQNQCFIDPIIEMVCKFSPDQKYELLSILNKDKETVLHLALKNKNYYTFSRILEIVSKINSNQQYDLLTTGNADGETVFHLAISLKNDSAVDQIIKMVSNFSSEQQQKFLNITNKSGETVLDIAHILEYDFALGRISEMQSKCNSK